MKILKRRCSTYIGFVNSGYQRRGVCGLDWGCEARENQEGEEDAEGRESHGNFGDGGD